MKLIANTSSFEILVLDRTSPNSLDESDRKWIQSELIIKLNGFSAHYSIELFDEDLYGFYDSVENFLKDFSLPIMFNTLEESIFLMGAMNERGQINWDGYVIYPIGNGNKLSFRFETELAQVDNLLVSLNRELSDIKNYPPNAN